MLPTSRRNLIKTIIAGATCPALVFSSQIKKGKNKMDLTQHIMNGNITDMEKTIAIKTLEWHAHPSYTGVSLLHLITGDMTEKRFSSHLVKINANCCIDRHIHAEQYELHEVLTGAGQGVLVDEEIDYHPGSMVIIPNETEHLVRAGDETLYLLAKFFPALL